MSAPVLARTETPLLTERFADLHRLRTGIAVPYVVQWTAWRNERVRDPEWGWVKTCACIPGLGEPLLTEICHTRQRDVMARRACQMCGHPITGEPFCFLNPGLDPAQNQTNQPPFHRACGQWAFAVCPGMLRISRDGGLKRGKPVQIAECSDYTVDGCLDTGAVLPAAQAPLTFADRDTVRNLVATLPATKTLHLLNDWLAGGLHAN